VSEPDERDSATLVMDGLVQASFGVMALLSQVAAAHDLSVTQLRVLAILRDREPRMAELAAHLGLEKSSVSGLIDRAVRRGLVRRGTGGDDARAVRVGLTPEGGRLARALTERVAEALAPAIGTLGPADQRRLAGLLEKLLAGSGSMGR
jgi:MarR family transcriptional regulator, lower aerobic nicotinate degradation pathway regulator